MIEHLDKYHHKISTSLHIFSASDKHIFLLKTCHLYIWSM